MNETLELFRLLTGREYVATAIEAVNMGKGKPETVFMPLFIEYEKVGVLDTVRRRALECVGQKPLPMHTVAEYELISAIMWHYLVEVYPFPSLEAYH